MTEYITIVGVVALAAVCGFRYFGHVVAGKAQQDAECVASLDPDCARGNVPGLEPGSFCFVAGTPVVTDHGPRAIETLRPGDVVLAWNETTHETIWRPIARTSRTDARPIVDIDVRAEDGAHETLHVTPEHPFYVPRRGWVTAGKLRDGDGLVTWTGAPAEVTHTSAAARATVYNLEVSDVHTYFAGTLGTLVHNQCTQAPAPSSSNVEVSSVGLGVTLPPNRTLARPSFLTKVATGDSPVNVDMKVSRGGLDVTFDPPLTVDPPRPYSDVALSGFHYDFKAGKVSDVQMTNTQGFWSGGWLSAQAKTKKGVNEFVDGLVKGTPMARPGYDPFSDPNAESNLLAIKDHLASGPGSSKVGAGDLTDVTVQTTFSLTSPIERKAEQGSVVVAAQTPITVRTVMQGTAQTAEDGKMIADHLEIETDAITLQKNGKDVARLNDVTISPGPSDAEPVVAQATKITPLGTLDRAEKAETGLRSLGNIFGRAAGRLGPDRSVAPVAVEGFAADQINDALTRAAPQVLLEAQPMVPSQLDPTKLFPKLHKPDP